MVGPQTEARAKSAWSAGAMDETAAAYLHERALPYFTMFGQGSRPYKDLEGKPCLYSSSRHLWPKSLTCLEAALLMVLFAT